ncbi:MAG: OmpA family protein [Verrucomicrobiales bacterium]|nr:OmpA family protein [Verrucomicrobiales bacterium]
MLESRPQPSEVPSAGGDPRQAEAMDELRRLLLGRQQERWSDLARRVEDPSLRAEDVSRVLPQAVARCSKQDGRLSQALAPAVESALRTSIRRDPRVLANAIFPIIGPAIRQAVSDSLRRLVETLNRAMELGLSWRGLAWRWEAWRTGRPLGEVVLAHSLIFRVEQVFLIHRPTGLLLVDVAAPGLVAENQDVISAMLTAVRDFVKDAFRTTPGDELSTARVGDLDLWVESGPHAILAAAIRGQAPVEYREKLRRTLEAIHRDEASTLAGFSGDSAPLAFLQSNLEECLEVRHRTGAEGGGRSWKLLAVSSVAILVLVAWLGNTWWQHRREEAFLDRLRTEPGILVTEARRSGGRLWVSGLRDPMAADPASLAWSARLSPDEDVVFRWEPYLALTPDLTLRRARARLNPPSGVNLDLQGGALILEGVGSPEWNREAARLGASVPGVDRVDVSGLSHDGAAQVQRLVETLQRQTLYFDTAQTVLAGQVPTVNAVVEAARALESLVGRLGKKASLVVVGHADRSGREELNTRLSQQRAEAVRSRLVAAGLSPEFVQGVGVGSSAPSRPQSPTDAANRRVTFEVRWVR